MLSFQVDFNEFYKKQNDEQSLFFKPFVFSYLCISYHDRIKGKIQVQMMEILKT